MKSKWSSGRGGNISKKKLIKCFSVQQWMELTPLSVLSCFISKAV